MAEERKAAPSEREWAALAAIDWADQKHVWCLLATGSQVPQFGELENTPEAVDSWAADLYQRFGGGRWRCVWNRAAGRWCICSASIRT